MKKVENQTFRGTDVDVDNTEFVKCVFESASFVYAGGALPKFVDCRFSRVTFKFTGAAENTLNFLGGLRKGGFAPAVDNIFKRIRHAG